MNGHDDKWKHFRAVAVCGLALVASREVYVRTTAPLRQQEAEILREVADLSGRIEAAHTTIAEVQAQQKDTKSIRSEGERMQDNYPPGSPMVWVPPLIKDHFARSGIMGAQVRLNTIQDDPDIPGYERGFWFAGLPIQAPLNVSPILLAAVDLELQNPVLRILDFAIRLDSDNPDQHLLVINVAVLAPKEKTVP